MRSALLFITDTAFLGVVSLARRFNGLCALIRVVSLALLLIHCGALFLLKNIANLDT